jgi:hypothetical protein
MFFTYILFNMDSINNKCFQECEQRWTLHNGNIYNSVPLDNDHAKRWCSDYGATLANIHNQDDLNLFKNSKVSKSLNFVNSVFKF